jgi:F-type H+-transporting ATPase subunit delta
MTLSAVASRYANALAGVVTSPSSPLRPEIALAELQAFETTLRDSPELQNALVTPAVAASRKKAVVNRIADALQLSRIPLAGIIQTLEVVLDERLGFARAEVSSPRELTGEQRAALTSRLEQLTGKRIRMRFAVDDSLIGGVVARIGSTVYDGSVRGELASLGRRLCAES